MKNTKKIGLDPRAEFLRFEKGAWRGFVKKGYEDLTLLTEGEEEWFKKAIRLFNRYPNRVYEVPFPFGNDLTHIVVKSFGWRERFHYWVSPLMRSKALNSFETALLLLEKGLGTPPPLAAFERRERYFVRENLYVTESLGHTTTLRQILRKGEDRELRDFLIGRVGKFLRIMHDAGIFHRDLTLANFLIKDEEHFYLVDLNRARPKKRPLKLLERIDDISRMDFLDEEFRIFLRSYFEPEEVEKKVLSFLLLRSRLRRGTRTLRKALISPLISSLTGQRSGHGS